MKRRDFMKGAAAAGLALRFSPRVFSGQAASLGPLPQLAMVEGESPAAITREAVALIGGMKAFVGKGDKVVITKNIGEMKTILEKIVQNSKIKESRSLAEAVQRNLVRTLSQDPPACPNLGVKGGPFWVLIGGEMPSILVEISHLSNSKEEAKLKTKKYRDLAAQGIYGGIMEYIRSLGKG
ncbi:MAG: hypothetical protein A2W20_06470 [Candidatus Aminicenantes bacterium RBG_16_66_30]|nr:MAG: hypothetical protein A2W20_06470 [Candidatus Aminicenantes bacterium RBG_16_66_30]